MAVTFPGPLETGASLFILYLTVIYRRDIGCLFLPAYRHSQDDLRYSEREDSTDRQR